MMCLSSLMIGVSAEGSQGACTGGRSFSEHVIARFASARFAGSGEEREDVMCFDRVDGVLGVSVTSNGLVWASRLYLSCPLQHLESCSCASARCACLRPLS